MRRALAALGCAFGAVILLLAPWPLPIWFAIQTDVAADGAGSATFYWRPAGAVGLLTRDNPWVYVEIRKPGPRGRTHTERVWADTPCDGVNRLRSVVPWPVQTCPAKAASSGSRGVR
jgi:hypothetical protein